MLGCSLGHQKEKEVLPMFLTRLDPFKELDQMHERLTRLFDETLNLGGQQYAIATTDIYEEDGKLIVESNLPGFKPEEVDVNITENRLEIKAQQSEEKETRERNYIRRESVSGSFYRQVALPGDVEIDSAKAEFEDGTLKVVFPKKELPQPKKLEIAAKSSESKEKQVK